MWYYFMNLIYFYTEIFALIFGFQITEIAISQLHEDFVSTDNFLYLVRTIFIMTNQSTPYSPSSLISNGLNRIPLIPIGE